MGIEFELADVGVDWITSTATKTNASRALALPVHLLALQEEKRGMQMRAWAMSGYHGLACGSVQFGERDDGFIFRLGGAVAKKHWRHVFDVCRRTSRLDLQYTLRFNRDPFDVIARHYRQAKRERRRCPGGPTFSMVQASDQSSTLYLGSRASDVYVRIYDKQRQSKMDHWQRCVRFEAEFKNVAAMRVAHELLASPDEGGSVLAIVGDLLESRRQSRWLTGVARASIDAPLPASDASRKLTWLRTQVAPVVNTLMELGYVDEVLMALSISRLPNMDHNALPDSEVESIH